MYTWGSFRAGGASHDFMCSVPISVIKFRGRWGAERTLEHYVHECMTYLNLSSLPESVLYRVNRLAALSHTVCE